MLFQWADKSLTPGFTMRDRTMGIIRSLSITTVRQIQIITGWSEYNIKSYLKSIKQLAEDPVDIDKDDPRYKRVLKKNQELWLKGQQLHQKGPFAYSLGLEGIKYVDQLKNEFNPTRKHYAPHGQMRHFVGTNEVLIRAILAGYKVDAWYGQSETMSQLHYKLSPFDSPVQPDASIKIKGAPAFFIEFDTGTENGNKIINKMYRYLDLQNIMESHPDKLNVYPVVWVTFKESRKQFLEKKWMDAQNTFSYKYKRNDFDKTQHTLPNRIPQMFFFTEGQETAFLAGGTESIAI
jgi:Replication-relaxation